MIGRNLYRPAIVHLEPQQTVCALAEWGLRHLPAMRRANHDGKATPGHFRYGLRVAVKNGIASNAP